MEFLTMLSAQQLASIALLSTASPIGILQNLVWWTAAAVLIVTSGLIVYSLIRLQRRTAAKADQAQLPESNFLLDLLWTLIPIAILIALLVLTFRVL